MIQHIPLRVNKHFLWTPRLSSLFHTSPSVAITVSAQIKNFPRIDLYIDSLRFSVIFISLFPVALICSRLFCLTVWTQWTRIWWHYTETLWRCIVSVHKPCVSCCWAEEDCRQAPHHPWGNVKMHLSLKSGCFGFLTQML